MPQKEVYARKGGACTLPNSDDSTAVHTDGSPLDRNFGVTLEAIKNCKKRKKERDSKSQHVRKCPLTLAHIAL